MPQSALYPLEADLVILDKPWTEGDFEPVIAKVEASGYRVIFRQEDFIVLARNSLDRAFLPSLVWTERHGR
jgi:hypothetical protein